MANISGTYQPAESDGVTFTVTTGATSPVKTLYMGATFLITTTAAVTLTFGGSGAISQLGSTFRAPTTPTATIGFALNPNTPAQLFWLGPNRDSFQVFNNTGGSATVSYQIVTV